MSLGIGVPWDRRVPLQLPMCPRLRAMLKTLRQKLLEVLFVQNDHVIQAVPPQLTGLCCGGA